MDFCELLDTLTAGHNPQRAQQMSAYMRHRFDFLGIGAPERRRLCKTAFAAAKKAGTVDWAFVERCWANRYRELQYVALDYLKLLQHRLDFNELPRLKALALDKSWWDTIDCLDTLIGGMALADARVNDVLLQWSTDDNIWLRRIAIDHQLLRKAQTDTALLEAILVNNLNRSEFFINKAIGWSLRAYAKTDPDWVRGFIERHRSGLSKLSIREASKYLSEAA